MQSHRRTNSHFLPLLHPRAKRYELVTCASVEGVRKRVGGVTRIRK